ncbi:50S ribosomal protein L29 [Tropheryma whipplei]|nr:50S ribosomal protein L29 [Tropheryma whipplei]
MMLGSKGLSPTDLRGMTDDHLRVELKNAKEEVFKLRFQSATGQLAHNARLRAVRRDIARIYTVMRERDIGIRSVQEEVSQ